MPGDRRAGAAEHAAHVNAAAGLLEAGVPAAEAARVLAGRLGCSQRQARRYLARAAESGRVEVPGEGTVFTVRLPVRLAAAVREHARASGRTISSVAARRWRSSWPVLTGTVRPGETAAGGDGARLLPPCCRGNVSGLRHLGAAAAGQDRRPGGGRRRPMTSSGDLREGLQRPAGEGRDDRLPARRAARARREQPA